MRSTCPNRRHLADLTSSLMGWHRQRRLSECRRSGVGGDGGMRPGDLVRQTPRTHVVYQHRHDQRTRITAAVEAQWLKAPYKIRFARHGACRLPCTWVNRNVWHVARMSRTPENRVKRIYSSFYFRADSAARACAITQSERSRHLKRPSPYTIGNARRVACHNAPKCTHPAFEIFSYLSTWNSCV